MSAKKLTDSFDEKTVIDGVPQEESQIPVAPSHIPQAPGIPQVPSAPVSNRSDSNEFQDKTVVHKELIDKTVIHSELQDKTQIHSEDERHNHPIPNQNPAQIFSDKTVVHNSEKPNPSENDRTMVYDPKSALPSPAENENSVSKSISKHSKSVSKTAENSAAWKWQFNESSEKPETFNPQGTSELPSKIIRLLKDEISQDENQKEDGYINRSELKNALKTARLENDISGPVFDDMDHTPRRNIFGYLILILIIAGATGVFFISKTATEPESVGMNTGEPKWNISYTKKFNLLEEEPSPIESLDRTLEKSFRSTQQDALNK